MLTNELMNLQKLIIEKLIIKNAKDEIYELYKLHLSFENVIAQVYLDRYTKKLQSKNNLRISSLSDIYEKNIINHYQAHLEWLNDLAKSVEFRNSKFFPQTNHTLCTFGKWLQDSGKTIIQNNSKFKSISKQHENLHLMAKQIKNYIAKKEENNHILLTCLEKCEMLSLSLGTELALIDNTLINSKASKDPLTGALNRQRLNQLYINQLEISFATSEPFILVMCDFDYFKNINDTYGHLAGDKMLKSFVNLVKKSLRNSDMIIRYGGEEFVFILPAIKTEKARLLLNKIRVDFSEFFIIHEENKISTTLSMGMLEIDPDNEESYLTNFENAISIVDKKLYEAKNSGRNKVC
jgi:diguanylate cyclase (GGDEF)-like protein